MARYLSILLFITFSFTIKAQVTLTVALSADTIGLSDAIQISYTLDGARERIEIQTFDGIQIVQGPNISSSMSYVNGAISEKYIESYIIRPSEAGEFYLPSASVVINGETLETEPLKLVVLPYDHYKQDKSTPNTSKSAQRKEKSQAEKDEEYQRLIDKRNLAKKKKKF